MQEVPPEENGNADDESHKAKVEEAFKHLREAAGQVLSEVEVSAFEAFS